MLVSLMISRDALGSLYWPNLGKNNYILQSNDAKKYFSSPFNYFIASYDVMHQPNCLHTSQHNGLAEQKNLDLKDHSSSTFKIEEWP